MDCEPELCVATILTTKRFLGRWGSVTCLMLWPFRTILRLPFTNTSTRTTRAPVAWCSLNLNLRASPHLAPRQWQPHGRALALAPPIATTPCWTMSREERPSITR